MELMRIARHLLTLPSTPRRMYPAAALATIEQAIAASEQRHAGQVRFVVEGALDGLPLWRGQSGRERAIEVFAQLGVWDTEHNNGVLIYLLLADHDVEIVADRGIHAKVGGAAWEAVCREMETLLRQGRYQDAALAGIEGVTRHLAAHFPARSGGTNELSNQPVML
jgi:uncharacterized membrane protein